MLYPEQRNIETQWSDAAMAELRNQPWEKLAPSLGKILRLSQRHRLGDVWAPSDLQVGDIVKVDLPTDHVKEGEFEIWPRNCLIAGIDLDEETLEVKAFRLLRFSYADSETNAETELLINNAGSDINLQAQGLRRKEIVLRTGSPVDVVPPDSTYFGYYIDRVGHVSPGLFPQIQEALDRAFDKNRRRGYIRNHAGLDLSRSICVPALHPEQLDHQSSFILPEFDDSAAYRSLDAGTQEIMAVLLAEQFLLREAGRRHIIISERNEHREVKQRANDELAATKALIRRMQKEQRLSLRNQVSILAGASRVISERDREIDACLAAQADPEIAERPELPSAFLPIREIIEQQMALDHNKIRHAAALADIREQNMDPRSAASFRDFGINGFDIGSQVSHHLPEHLFRGRFLLIKIPNLMDMEDDGMAFRPCLLWNAYARINEHGAPELAGIDVHPCTRRAAKQFRHNMKAHPFGYSRVLLNDEHHSGVRRDFRGPSFLVAQRMIRLPVESARIHIYPDASGLHHFTADMIERFDRDNRRKAGCDGRKIAVMTEVNGMENEEGDAPTRFIVSGEDDLPDGWLRIELPTPPTGRLREQFEKWQGLLFASEETSGRPVIDGTGPRRPKRLNSVYKAPGRSFTGN